METNSRINRFEKAFEEFVRKRFEAKQKAGEAPEPDAIPEAPVTSWRDWVQGAARRAPQLQQVTHAVKFIHPDARGSCLYARGNAAAGDILIGTHTLGERLVPDVVGNAAALDVYKFLEQEVEGKSLLQWAVQRDEDFLAALSDDPAQAEAMAAAFASLLDAPEPLTSHRLAKQIQWPLGATAEEGYHLLNILHPSSFSHEVWWQISRDRFSDEAKAARAARKAGLSCAGEIRDYPWLVVQNFGGSKPQNVSLLNSVRRGEHYLLSSLPPAWTSSPVQALKARESVLTGAFGHRQSVRQWCTTLKEFLAEVADQENNRHLRARRQALSESIRDEFLQFAAEAWELPPGWTGDHDCQLHPVEQCWLDPWRAETDPDFAQQYRAGTWRDDICRRFALWLNGQLHMDKKTPMGAPEAAHWQTLLEKELRLLRLEIDDE